MPDPTPSSPAPAPLPHRRGPSWPVPGAALLLLTLLVAAVHGWLLQALPDSLGLAGQAAPAANAPLVLSTRRIEPVGLRASAAAPSPAAAGPSQRPAAVTSSAGSPATSTPPSPAGSSTSSSAISPVASALAASAAASAAEKAVMPELPAVAAPAAAEPALQQPAGIAATEPGPDTSVPASAKAVGLSGAALVVPGSVRLNYTIDGLAKGIHYSAQGVLTWQQEDGHYDAKLVVRVFLLGERSLSSTGSITPDGLVPKRFSDKARSEQATHFLPEQGRISFSANTPDAPWQRGAQDRVSLFFQLASLLAADPARAVAGVQVPLYVAGPRDAEEWVFKVGGLQTLDLPRGPTPAVYLLRQPRREYDQKVEIWLAPDLGFLPVRFKQTQSNGDFVDQQLAATTPP